MKLVPSPAMGQYFPLLSMLYTTFLIVSVLLDYKFITIGGMIASSATFVISTTFFLNDIITEVYGYAKARSVVWSSLFCLLIFSYLGFFVIKIESPLKYMHYADAYSTVFTLMFRACMANFLAIVAGSFLNMYLISRWKMYVKGKYFWFRSLCTSFVGEILYSIFVVSLVNIGIVSFRELLQILMISLFFKLVFNMIMVGPASFLCSVLKRKEGIDVYDYHLNFNPFKLSNSSEVEG